MMDIAMEVSILENLRVHVYRSLKVESFCVF